jgi:hypothetical protein
MGLQEELTNQINHLSKEKAKQLSKELEETKNKLTTSKVNNYNSFSGLDMKVLLDGKELTNVQLIELNKHSNYEGCYYNGKLSIVIFKYSDFDALFDKTCHLTILIAQADRSVHTLFDRKVRFINSSVNMSVDDLICLETYGFVTVKDDE